MKINKYNLLGRIGLYLTIVSIGLWVVLSVKDLESSWIAMLMSSFGGAMYIVFGSDVDE